MPEIPRPETTDAAAPRRLCRIMDACETLRVSRRTIYNWIAAGKIETCRVASGMPRIYVDTLIYPNPIKDPQAPAGTFQNTPRKP